MNGYKGNGNAQYIVNDPSVIDENDLAFGPNGPKGCVDVNECSDGSHNCVAQTCHNQPGSFYCSSDPDPMGVCDVGAHECHVNALCVVSASNRGYDCVCKAGLEGIEKCHRLPRWRKVFVMTISLKINLVEKSSAELNAYFVFIPIIKIITF